MSLSDTKEKSNGSKLSRLLIDGGTEVLRSAFDSIHSPATLSGKLNLNQLVLSDLRRKRVLNKSQWDKLFPPGGVAPDSKNFDITLLFILLRNICGLSPPSTGWDKLPPATETTLEAHFARIKYFRNEVYGHISNTSIEDSKFESYWKDISSVLVALGLDQNEVDSLKYEPTSTDYIKLLEEWTVQDQDLKEAVLSTRAETRETRHVLQQQIRLQGEKMDSAVERLRAEIREQRGSSVPSECSNLAKYEFTGLVESLCGYRFQDTRQWILEKIQHHISNEAEQVIVITARPGVGKSVIAALTCQAMKEKEKLAAYHFIEHGNSLRNTPKLIVESLASHLCESVDGFEGKLEEKLSQNKNKELHNMNCKELFTLLVEEPLNAVSKPPETALIVIDALDEIDQSTKDEFVKALFRVTLKLPKWIQLVVTTRPMPNVIPKLPNVTVIDLESCCNKNKEDINFYLLSHLQKIYLEETREKLKTAAGTLCNKSDGIFLYAHFAVEIIEEKKPSLSQVDKIVPTGISNVYEEYVNRPIKDHPIEEDTFFSFLEALVASEGRLPKSMAFEILKINRLSRRERNSALRSLFDLFPVDNEHVTVFHKSLIDWLLGSEEEQHDFIVKPNDGHRVLAPLCFQQMELVKSQENFPSTLNESENYALRNGFRHMLRAGGFEEQLELCVTNLELLASVLYAFNGSVHQLLDELKFVINVLKLSSLHLEEFIAELSYFSGSIQNIQIVFQAAVNCSEENEVRKQAFCLLGTPKYHHFPWSEFTGGLELPIEVQFIFDFMLSLENKVALCNAVTTNDQSIIASFNTESRKLSAVEDEDGFCCAISPVANYPVAAVITNDRVKLINVETLQTLDVIKTESDPSTSRPDAAATTFKEVKLIDPETIETLKTLGVIKTKSDPSTSRPDAAAATFKEVKLIDPETIETLKTLGVIKTESDPSTSRPDAAAATFKEVKLIDPETIETLKTLGVIKTKSDPSTSRPDAAAATFEEVKLIDLETLETLKTLGVIKTASTPKVCCFLSQGAQLAIGYTDCAVRVWDIRKLKLETTLNGHTNPIKICLPLQGNRLLTGDSGTTVLLWQSLQPDPQFVKVTDCRFNRCSSENQHSVAVSPDQTKIAVLCGSYYADLEINLFSADDGKMLMQLIGGLLNCVISFIDNSHILCNDFSNLKIINTDGREKQEPKVLYCPRDLTPDSGVCRINKSELEFVAVFDNSSDENAKLMSFRLHNIV